MSLLYQGPIDDLLALRRKQIAQRQVVAPLEGLRALASMQARPTDLSTEIRTQEITLLGTVTEIKATGPEDANNASSYDPVTLARRLVTLGVKGIVVPKDEHAQRGGIEDLTLLCQAVRGVPVIRQDLILEEYQVVEARAAGADGVVLTMAVVEAAATRQLLSITQRNRMTAVLHVHSEAELRTALSFEPRVIAIDNRALYTGDVDLGKTRRLLPLIPGHIAVISMGGLCSASDVAQVADPRLDAVLVDQPLFARAEALDAVKAQLAASRQGAPDSHDAPGPSGKHQQTITQE